MSAFEKWSVLISSLLTGLTGLLYLWMKYLLEPAEPWAVINHPLQPWLLKAHIVVAPLLVFAIGMITLRHVWRHFRSGMRWGWRTGITSGLAVVPMVMSGYFIQGITSPGWLQGMAIAHIVVSVVYLLAVSVHAVVLTPRYPTAAPLERAVRRPKVPAKRR